MHLSLEKNFINKVKLLARPIAFFISILGKLKGAHPKTNAFFLFMLVYMATMAAFATFASTVTCTFVLNDSFNCKYY